MECMSFYEMFAGLNGGCVNEGTAGAYLRWDTNTIRNAEKIARIVVYLCLRRGSICFQFIGHGS
jgi:hypothetical protein